MMQRLKTRVSYLLLLFVALANSPALAQQFKYKAAVQKVSSNGFYRITLQPALAAKCQSSLADIRLMDEKGAPVPYLLGNTLPVQAQSSYQELPRVLTNGLKDSLTSYVIENKGKAGINQLWIKLQNTAVNRTINLLGSDDLHHWFAIEEQISLRQASSGNKGTFEELLTFPVSTYRYFKIQVNDRTRVPVRILQTGIYLKQQVQPEYVPVPVARFTSERKADSSLINIYFNDASRVNKLHLQFAGSKYYQRRIQLYSVENKTQEWLKDTLISSTGNGDVYLSGKANQLRLVILNQDDPPLEINAVQAYQLKQSVVAYLEKQHHYQLYFGNDTITAPNYDLKAFMDSIRHQLPTVSHGRILPLPRGAINNKSGVVPAWVLWIAGGLALLILLALTLKMTKEVGQRQSY